MTSEKLLRKRAYFTELVRLGMGVVEYARMKNISSPRASQVFKELGLTASVRVSLRGDELIERADAYISAQKGSPIALHDATLTHIFAELARIQGVPFKRVCADFGVTLKQATPEAEVSVEEDAR